MKQKKIIVIGAALIAIVLIVTGVLAALMYNGGSGTSYVETVIAICRRVISTMLFFSSVWPSRRTVLMKMRTTVCIRHICTPDRTI